jgi:hypothetical protein
MILCHFEIAFKVKIEVQLRSCLTNLLDVHQGETMFCILTERKTIPAWAGFKTAEEGRGKIILYKLWYISIFVLHKLHNKSYIINQIQWYYKINYYEILFIHS